MNVYTKADPETTFNEYLEKLTGEPGLYEEVVRFNAAYNDSESSHD